MPTERIGDYVTLPSYAFCNNTDHLPSEEASFDRGSYRHTCPECGYQTYFHIYKRKTYG